ncbi:MAG: hypothetical protein LHW48_09215 [Candidatus Cloacimonetes bacterium]|nr:hypothetical protein [Candidatus Cloacimonadota bacterium]
MKKVILSVIVIAAMFSLLQAAPFQTLGMLRTPDAYVLPHRAAEFMLAGYYRDVAEPVKYDGFVPYMMAGVGLFDRVELGMFVGDKIEDEPLVYFLNLKFKILQETPRLPQVSIGMDNIFSPITTHGIHDGGLTPTDDFYYHPDKSGYEYYSPYAVASKQAVVFGMPWMFNLGFGTNRFVGQVSRSRIFNGIFMSAEMSPIRDLALQGEFDGHEFNAGIKYSWKNFGFKVGAQALEDLAKDNGYEDNLRVAFAISYLFDKYAEAQRRPDLRRYAMDSDLEDPYIVQTGTTPTEDGVIIPPTGDTIPGSGEVVVIPPDADTRPGEVAVVTPGTTLETPGLSGTGGGTTYAQLSPEVRDLLQELQELRKEREKAQKSLDDLRSWIQELKANRN